MNEKNENDDLKNKDEPTACKHSASHSAMRHFLLFHDILTEIFAK